MTVGMPGSPFGFGHYLRISGTPPRYTARFVSPVGIYHCSGARREAESQLLSAAYENKGEDRVRVLNMEPHPRTGDCWLHADGFCLSIESD
jgi:hypothetical protein